MTHLPNIDFDDDAEETEDGWAAHHAEEDKEWQEHLSFHKTPSPNCHYCMSNAD
jgi:hypothetical protein